MITAERMQALVNSAEMTTEDARAIRAMGADQHVMVQQQIVYKPWQYSELISKAVYMTASGKSAAQLREENEYAQDERQWELSKQRQWRESADEMRRLAQ